MAERSLSEELLGAAGYVFDRVYCRWEDPTSGRQIDAEVAAMLTREQLAGWIGRGVGRRRSL
jgi:hypothetical protein